LIHAAWFDADDTNIDEVKTRVLRKIKRTTGPEESTAITTPKEIWAVSRSVDIVRMEFDAFVEKIRSRTLIAPNLSAPKPNSLFSPNNVFIGNAMTLRGNSVSREVIVFKLGIRLKT